MLLYMTMSEVPAEVIETNEHQVAGPIVTVDRTLRHFVTNIDIGVDDVVNFYEALPNENKPPIDELRAHFTASALIEDDTITNGLMLWEGTKKGKVTATPELPETDKPTLIVYMGSMLLHLEDKEMLGAQVSKTFRHELTHYGQGKPEHLGEKTRLQKIGNRAMFLTQRAFLQALIDRAWLKTGVASFAAAELIANEGLGDSLEIAAGAAVIAHVMGTKQRGRDTEVRMRQHYYNDEREVEARGAADQQSELVTLQPADYEDYFLRSLTVKRNSRFSQWFTTDIHTRLALSPPGSSRRDLIGGQNFPEFKRPRRKGIHTKK